jgi:hypothetical protein|tara:strand:- start:42 stop:581 length:540 start_codon:yes stop_codon:yes gene_type:complete
MQHELYNWEQLITSGQKLEMRKDIDNLIALGKYWDNSPPYQTNVNIFGEHGEHWTNLKMSFIWSCFAYMKQERQIKSVKSWGYKTNKSTVEDRDNYWHQHIREGSTVLSGVYYLHLPIEEENDLETAGTELAPHGVKMGGYYAPWRDGHWLIFPGETWHRPGVLACEEDRYIVAADMEF